MTIEPELLVTVSITLPQTDRAALADHLAPMLQAAIAVGGRSVNFSIQGYTPDEDDG